jgi:hypothetical protein
MQGHDGGDQRENEAKTGLAINHVGISLSGNAAMTEIPDIRNTHEFRNIAGKRFPAMWILVGWSGHCQIYGI